MVVGLLLGVGRLSPASLSKEAAACSYSWIFKPMPNSIEQETKSLAATPPAVCFLRDFNLQASFVGGSVSARSFPLSLSWSDLWLCKNTSITAKEYPGNSIAEAALAEGVQQPFLSPNGIAQCHLTFCGWRRKTCWCIGQELAFWSRMFPVDSENLMCVKAGVEKTTEKFYAFRLLGSLFTEKWVACCWGWNKAFALRRKSPRSPGSGKPGNLPTFDQLRGKQKS